MTLWMLSHGACVVTGSTEDSVSINTLVLREEKMTLMYSPRRAFIRKC